jgi:hypothetical protein
MFDTGIRLQFLIGANIPLPAPFDLLDTLEEIEVTSNDEERDGFQLTFKLGRKPTERDYPLLRDGLLDPPNKVTLMVTVNSVPFVLINGMITNHQFVPSTQPGQSQLIVTGDDLGLQLNKALDPDTHPNMSDKAIVDDILDKYPDLIGHTFPTTDTPSENDRITTQPETDLDFIKLLSERNGYVFYIEPSLIPGKSIAYWGPRDRLDLLPQIPLTLNMGPADNVQSLSFGYNALSPVTPEVTILDPFTNTPIKILVPNIAQGNLASQPAAPLRTEHQRNAANLNLIQAALRAMVAASQGAEAASGNGQLDTVRYGRVLRSRHKVEVRGVGETHDGSYYVKQVTHHIRRGQYTQSFQLSRGGRGTTTQRVII